MQIQESNEPLTEEQLNVVQTELGLSLPLGYRQFLLEHNGGYPDAGVFRLPTGRREMVDRFLGVHDGEYDNLVKYHKIYRDRLPFDLMPIAHDPGGNLICIGVTGERNGRVFFWDHEEEAEENTLPTGQNVSPVANSFDAFWAMLTTLDEA